MSKFLIVLGLLCSSFAAFGKNGGGVREENMLKKARVEGSFRDYIFYNIKPFDAAKEFSCKTPHGEESVRRVNLEEETEGGERIVTIRGKNLFGNWYTDTKIGTCLWDNSMTEYSCLNQKISFIIPPSSQLEIRVFDRSSFGEPSLDYRFNGVYSKMFSDVELNCSQGTSFELFTVPLISIKTVKSE